MWRLPPSRSMVVYNAAIRGWADNGDPTAGGRIETLLNDMERRRVAPESIFYGVVINAYANGGHVNAVRSAEKILRRMEQAVDMGRGGATDLDVQPGAQGVGEEPPPRCGRACTGDPPTHAQIR